MIEKEGMKGSIQGIMTISTINKGLIQEIEDIRGMKNHIIGKKNRIGMRNQQIHSRKISKI